ncbi:hypothetical protein EIN_345780 [Entamoeba invadens IP1]|uniref:Uncharacterized protein n=1 Tax=Entamoeba invadens IP1 TaxID=370355 RepID=L7FJA0_ENTIV|nr:hypothetical protein EIN_345780 [Entamoeba invadens IP1]ELP83992.1 hypothetical protein EIN_345780 [Entamoeba invadens IP1]|eukprot:XP_004183338.1 hypothetical protein EIN_345780 [Entamoeba invadens IP1]
MSLVSVMFLLSVGNSIQNVILSDNQLYDWNTKQMKLGENDEGVKCTLISFPNDYVINKDTTEELLPSYHTLQIVGNVMKSTSEKVRCEISSENFRYNFSFFSSTQSNVFFTINNSSQVSHITFSSNETFTLCLQKLLLDTNNMPSISEECPEDTEDSSHLLGIVFTLFLLLFFF